MDVDDIEMVDSLTKNNQIVKRLTTCFGDKVDIEIIESVAYESGYNLEDSINHLLEITQIVELPQFEEEPIKQEASSSASTKLFETSNIKASGSPLADGTVKSQIKYDRIISTVKSGACLIILMRGIPGSGKSYLARKIVQKTIGNCNLDNYILSTDDFFMRKGEYLYNSSLISDAHRWNQNRAQRLLANRNSPIIIDNTNTELFEMKPYCVWAVQNGYHIEVVEPNTSWAFNERECAKRNKHSVPIDKIRLMLHRYDRDVTPELLLKIFGLQYANNKPPQLRKFPPITKKEVPVEAPQNFTINLKDWGISRETLLSRRVVQPTKDENTRKDLSTFVDISEDVVKIDEATMTCETDWDWNWDFNTENCKTLTLKSRNGFDNYLPIMPRIGFLEKSTMTDAVISIDDVRIQRLEAIFENVHAEQLRDILEKCDGSFNEAVDVLSNDNSNLITYPKQKREITKLKEVKSPINSPKPSTSKSETSQTIHKKIVAINLDEDFDDFDDVIEVVDDEQESKSEMIEINLGDFFVSQLHKEFGDPKMNVPEGLQPVIEMPKALGRQLHALYLESIFKQLETQRQVLETMINEDEEFARQILAQDCALLDNAVRDQDTGRNVEQTSETEILTPETIAMKMTKQKLKENFPHINEATLYEIFSAHNYCYKDTCEALIESGAKNYGEIFDEPFDNSVIDEMKSAQDEVKEKEEDIVLSADELRAEAFRYQCKRSKIMNLAKQYYGRRMFDIASFYTDLAKQQTVLFEKYNNLAAEKFLQENFSRRQSFDTIDLHSLFVKEALIALDIFLDRNIMLLRSDNKTCQVVLIITGRGNRSQNKKPKIRPAVATRLTNRAIKFEYVNPGLIRAKILHSSPMTSNLSSE